MAFFTEILGGLRALFTWYFAVAPWERAVRVKWGKHDQLLGPGLHWRVPVRDRVYRHSVRLRSTEVVGQNITTADGKVVTLAFVVEWGIGDLLQVFRSVAHPERTLATRVKALIAERIASRALEDVAPLKLSEDITAEIRGLNWGLCDVRVRITEFINAAKTYRLLQGGNGYTEIDHETNWNDDMFRANRR
ncbi:hypothetical protein LCGC14_1286190 [marine sediment metagenome]|uniref:Band 7 domain-containing protein n=1 Tax=marine sediment metagenome TaxID=412755 RepID=A0A0F9NAD7_9ZZZZ